MSTTTSEPSVAVVGATGAVGNEIVELIAARGFPHSRLTLFASQSGAAGTLETARDEYLVEALGDAEDLAAFDLVFLAVPESVAADITHAAPGPLLIDLSGAARNPSSTGPGSSRYSSTFRHSTVSKQFPSPAMLAGDSGSSGCTTTLGVRRKRLRRACRCRASFSAAT